ncbi:hypothetical protein ACFCVO_11885 [Agromyces sp. NPDC056379]|uniref:hypothetical protein n=1 Tax=unclassified Agromyces TaxID=2639701 RepID=UPI0035DE1BD8
MKRTLSALMIAVLGAGIAVVGTAAPASASTPSVTASCISLDVNLADYSTDPGTPEVTEEVVVTPAVAEVSHTDYQYEQWKLGKWLIPYATGEFRWAHKDVGEYDIYDWGFYKFTGATQKHIDIEAKPAITETVVVTPAVPANLTPNTVTVEIDGDVVLDGAAFGESFDQSFALDKFTEQPYTVTVTSFDGEGAGTWQGTSSACALGAANAAAVIAASSCGAVDITVTNPALADDAINATTSAVVYVDGEAQHFLAIAENGTEQRTISFTEDSGDHKVVVRTGPAHGDVVLASATVPTDCEENAGPVEPIVGELSVTGSLVPGGAITVTGTGFAPNTQYDVELHSTPQALGTATTDGNGDFILLATIGTATPAGDHDVVVFLDGDEITSTGIVVAATNTPGATGSSTAPAAAASTAGAKPAAGLAETGVDANGIMLLALAMLLAGGAAFGITRAARSRA